MAGKIFDTYLDMHAICAAHHKISRKFIRPDNEIIDDSILGKLREQICVAESSILKTIKYNLNFDLPYQYLDELNKRYPKEIGREVFYMARMILLDVFRSGATMFYGHVNLAIAAVVFAFRLHHSCLTPLHLERQLALQQQTAMGPQPGVTPTRDKWSSLETKPSENALSPFPRGSNMANTPLDSTDDHKANGATNNDNGRQSSNRQAV